MHCIRFEEFIKKYRGLGNAEAVERVRKIYGYTDDTPVVVVAFSSATGDVVVLPLPCPRLGGGVYRYYVEPKIDGLSIYEDSIDIAMEAYDDKSEETVKLVLNIPSDRDSIEKFRGELDRVLEKALEISDIMG